MICDFRPVFSALEKKAKESKYKTDSTGRSRRLYDNGDVIAQVFLLNLYAHLAAFV